MPLDHHTEALFVALQELGTGYLLVVTGAGISAASGISTFRGSDPEAVWRQNDVRMATYDYFVRDPVRQLEWYLDRFEKALGAKPNPAHRALVDLEQWVASQGGQFRLVTQNIDTLHELAGSRDLIKVHGTLDRLRCSKSGCDNAAPTGSLPLPLDQIERFRRAPSETVLPRCPDCGSILRAHVLFFDEHYFEHADYRFPEVEIAGSRANLIVFVGTSFSVGVTDVLVRSGLENRAKLFSIDPAAGRARYPGMGEIQGRAEIILPTVVGELTRAA